MAGVKRIKTGKTGGCHDKNVSDPGRAVSRILSALAGKPAAERAIYLLRPNPEPQWDGPPRAPYLVLLPMGFTVPPRLLLGRWALTPPFHPYPANRAVCFLWHWPSMVPCDTTSRVHPALKTGYAASHPAEFGLSSPGKPEATLRPPGSENQAKLPVCPRPNKPLGQAGLTLAKRSLKGSRRVRRITTIPNNHGNRSRNQGPGFHPEIEEQR